jgi:L-fuculose-phosphate aldolase
MTEALARSLVETYRALARHGLNHGSSGNVSAWLGGAMLVTPTGATAESLTEGALVRMPLQGPAAPGSAPSSEWPMHAAVYAACPEAACVIHSHADACTALACLGEPLPAFHYMVVGFGGDTVPIAPYATFGTPALAEAVGRAIAGHKACLLANHGMIVQGPDPATALATALRLETLARQYLLARGAGRPRLLDAAEIAAARERYRTYGRPQPG